MCDGTVGPSRTVVVAGTHRYRDRLASVHGTITAGDIGAWFPTV
jgi:hypothetical protein